MIIDAHAHAAGDYASAESITTTVKKYEINKVILCTSPKNNVDLKAPPNVPLMKSPSSIYFFNRMLRLAYKSFKSYGDGNKYVFELKNRLPETVIQFLWVNPLDPQLMCNLDKNIREYQVKGIKLHQAWNPFTIDGSEFNQIVEVARENRLPIFIHLYSKEETWKLLQYVGSHRDVIFIIAHMLGLDIFKERAKDLHNVYFDTSGSERVRGRDVLEAIDLFGYEHVIFGSDTPYAKIGDQIEKLERLILSGDIKEHVFRLNIEHLLSLGTLHQQTNGIKGETYGYTI
ncbi:MAG: amidohydrolase family protein [Anaerolineales bacterium]|jgi:predicted TIM-barrel fold metal-dependent hydrolase